MFYAFGGEILPAGIILNYFIIAYDSFLHQYISPNFEKLIFVLWKFLAVRDLMIY